MTASLISLMIRDFDDVLKNPFRYVDLFLLHTLLSKKKSKNRHARPVTEGPKKHLKHLKLGQCLEIDDRRSLSKFGDVT